MSAIDDFLQHYIDGYLAYDIATMSQNDANGNGVGYPLLMTTCAAVELMGALLSPDKFSTFNKGHTYFEEYWNGYLYAAPSKYTPFGAATYQLVRHGIAHAFQTKGEIGVTRHRPDLHFTRDTRNLLIIDAVQLACDFMQSYHRLVKPRLDAPSTPNRASMDQRLIDMQTVYQSQSLTHGSSFASAPLSGMTTITTQSPATATGPAPGSLTPATPSSGATGPRSGP